VGAVEVHILNGPPGDPEFFVTDRAEEVAERNRTETRRDDINAGGKDRTAVEAADEERLARCRVLREGREQGRTVGSAEEITPLTSTKRGECRGVSAGWKSRRSAAK